MNSSNKISFSQKYPSLFYDILLSLGGRLEKLHQEKELSENFKRWITRQYRGLPLEVDNKILKKREERAWLYYDDKKESKIKGILKTIG